MVFNKRGFEVFRADVESALKEVAKKHKVMIDCGKINYADVDFTMQLHVIKNDNGEDGKKLLFEQNCIYYGFSKEDYERKFTSGGKVYKLIGFNTNSPKNVCSIYCVTDGKTYKCGAEMVKEAFAKQ